VGKIDTIGQIVAVPACRFASITVNRAADATIFNDLQPEINGVLAILSFRKVIGTRHVDDLPDDDDANAFRGASSAVAFGVRQRQAWSSAPPAAPHHLAGHRHGHGGGHESGAA